MGTTNVSARWTGKALNYVGIDGNGNQVLMGGEHTSPSQMMLLGLAGCMGMDVVSILKKKRQNITSFDIEVTGHNPDDYPKPFHTVELAFSIKGDQVDPKAVARAIELSMEKYCIVGQTLRREVELKTSFVIEE